MSFLPTPVFGISSTYINLSGIQKLGNSLARCCFSISIIFSSVLVARTAIVIGRSPNFTNHYFGGFNIGFIRTGLIHPKLTPYINLDTIFPVNTNQMMFWRIPIKNLNNRQNDTNSQTDTSFI